MITRLRGNVEGRTPDGLNVSLGPITVRVHVPAPTLMQLGSPGEQVELFTHLYIRDDTWALYGFTTEEQLRWFETLLGVTGVGPKAALAILSAVSIEALQKTIAAGDVAPLTRIPGIGRKTAGRLVLELHGKVDVLRVAAATPVEDADLVAALVSLGYSAREARSALSAVPKDTPLSDEEKIVLALRSLAKG